MAVPFSANCSLAKGWMPAWRRSYRCTARVAKVADEPALKHWPSNTSVGFMGDSLLAQLRHVVECSLGRRKMPTFGLTAVPTDVCFLRTLLRHAVDSTSGGRLVLNVGMWYNFEPSELVARPDLVRRTPAGWTALHMSSACNMTEAAQHPRGEDCASDGPSSERMRQWDGVRYGHLRRGCPHALGLRAYISDLKRLAQAIGALAADGHLEARRIVWRSTTPQHYANAPSGVFGTAASRSWPAVPRTHCAPIRDETAARQVSMLSLHIQPTTAREDCAGPAATDSQHIFSTPRAHALLCAHAAPRARREVAAPSRLRPRSAEARRARHVDTRRGHARTACAAETDPTGA